MAQVLGYAMLLATLASIVYCFFRPSFAIVLIFALYPAKQLIQSYLAIFSQNSAYYNYLIFLAVLAAVLGNISRNPNTWRGYGNRVFALTVILYVYALVGTLWSPGASNAWMLISKGYPYWIMQVLLLPLAVASLDEFRKSLIPTLVVGITCAVLFFTNPSAQWWAGRLTLDVLQLGNIELDRGNPLAMGTMGGMLMITAALLKPTRAGTLVLLIRIGAIFAGLGMAIASGSRGQTVLAVLAGVMVFPLARRVKNVQQFFVTVLLAGLFAAMAFAAFKFFLGQNTNQATRWSLDTWQEIVDGRAMTAWKMVEVYISSPGNWLMGLGTNAFSEIAGATDVPYAHNLPLEMLCELGVIGLVIFALISYMVLKDSKDLYTGFSADDHARATVAVLFGQALYLTFLSFKQGTFVSIPEPWYLWMLIAKLAAADRFVIAHQLHDAPLEVDIVEYSDAEPAAAYAEETYGDDGSAATPRA